MAEEPRSRAVVLGASMGGLLAARALADFYCSVVVVERDCLLDSRLGRPGVPQGKHPHALLGKDTEILGQLFPGLFDELEAEGAITWEDGDLSRYWSTFSGHLMVRSETISDPTSLKNYHLSRPLLERGVRRTVRNLPNVQFLDAHDFVGVSTDPDRNRVSGVRVRKHSRSTDTLLSADLVVDATGRGSRAPVFLQQLGYDRPPLDEVGVRIAYAT